MTCHEIDELVADFLMGSLDDAGRERMESHARECPRCRAELDSLGGVWELMGEIPAPGTGPASTVRFEEMVAAFRSGRDEGIGEERVAGSPSSARPRISGWLRAAAAVVLLSVGVAAGFMMGAGGGSGGARPGTSVYLLLVYEPSDLSASVEPAEWERLEKEYTWWWEELRRSESLVRYVHVDPRGGRLLEGESGPGDLAPLPPSRPGESLAWAILIRASGIEDAAAIARGCPTLRVGARIEVRPQWTQAG